MTETLNLEKTVEKYSTAAKMQVLVVSNETLVPDPLQKALMELDLDIILSGPSEVLPRLEKIPDIKVAVLLLDDEDTEHRQKNMIVREVLGSASIVTLDISSSSPVKKLNSVQNFMVYASKNESSEMLKGRLVMLMEIADHSERWRKEVERIQKIGKPVTEHLDAMDQEMILAARLQQDFLPHQLPQVTGVKFAAVYRPASWVSGDIYDVMRLDENHIGFYVADVVGHGMPAALLTMFIKRAITTKRIHSNHYELIEPGEVLSRLNDDMVNQKLSNFQFATGCYGLLNHKTMHLKLANAGHPMPMLINKQGQTTELQGHGSLLGVFQNQTFQTYEFQLQPGSKLLFYSDGVELAFVNEGPDKPLRFRKEFSDLANENIETMCSRLVEIIEQEEGSLHPRDDVTIVAMQIVG